MCKREGFSPNFDSVTWNRLAHPAPTGRLRGTLVSAPQPTHRDRGGQRGSAERVGPGCCQLISLPLLPRRFQSLRDHPSTATCPLSSFSASWVSCCDSPGLADTRATQHQGLEHFATANIPKAAAPGSASPKQGNLLGSQPRAGDNQRSTDHHRDCLQKCQKASLFFFSEAPKPLFWARWQPGARRIPARPPARPETQWEDMGIASEPLPLSADVATRTKKRISSPRWKLHPPSEAAASVFSTAVTRHPRLPADG